MVVTLKAVLGLAMAGLAAAAVEYVGFNGTGQIRTVWGYGDQYRADLGCLTAAGLWTADDSRCDIFDAVRFNASTFTLASSAGPCRVLGAEFTCAKGNEGYYFGLWPWGNSIAGVECLRWGQYGLMASSGRNPPLATDPPQEIHLTSYIEEGKYVWLAFGKVEGVSNH